MPGFFYVDSDFDLYPTIHIAHTYPEIGHHLHHIPLPYMAHNFYTKFHDGDKDVHQPKADVRETMKKFYLEVELPGIKEHSELRLRWTNDRTLLLTSKAHRPEIPNDELVAETACPAPAEGLAPAPETTTQTNGPSTNGEPTPAPVTQATPATEPTVELKQEQAAVHQKPKMYEPHLTVHERPVGQMCRAFNFPIEVDLAETHAKLDGGLLRIVVPKVIHAMAPGESEEKHFLHVPIKILHHDHENPVHPCS